MTIVLKMLFINKIDLSIYLFSNEGLLVVGLHLSYKINKIGQTSCPRCKAMFIWCILIDGSYTCVCCMVIFSPKVHLTQTLFIFTSLYRPSRRSYCRKGYSSLSVITGDSCFIIVLESCLVLSQMSFRHKFILIFSILLFLILL